MSKENIQLLWNISLAVLAVCSVILGLTALLDADLPDGLERLLGILDLIALPVFAYASVQKARAERRQTRSMP
jgi:hypothetical protein